MKVVVISDTHCRHQELVLPPGDMIIHCGDHSNKGNLKESLLFLDWYFRQDYKYKLMICGNHEKAWDTTQRYLLTQQAKDLGIIYLENSPWISPCGKTFWGSPVTKKFNGWAFMKDPGQDMARHWSQIPENLDVLITHGPPAGILDKNSQGESIGDEDLLQRIIQVKPYVHLFGHVHESYGHLSVDKTKFYNVSIWDHRTNKLNSPIVIDV